MIYDAWNTCNNEEFKNMRKSWQVKTGTKIKEDKYSTI